MVAAGRVATASRCGWRSLLGRTIDRASGARLVGRDVRAQAGPGAVGGGCCAGSCRAGLSRKRLVAAGKVGQACRRLEALPVTVRQGPGTLHEVPRAHAVDERGRTT